MAAFANDRCWFADAIESPAGARHVLDRLLSNAKLSLHIAFIDHAPFQPAAGRVLRIDERWTSFDTDVEAAGRALLVICITPHRYWSATIDGAPARLIPANVGFQALVIPPGRHHVSMRYRNPVVIWSALFSAVSALLLACAAVALRSRGSLPPSPR